jgi:hypothetical protein
MKYQTNKYSKSADFKIGRRLIQEYGFQEARRIGALDNLDQQKNKELKTKTKIKNQNKRKKRKNKIYNNKKDSE